MVQVPTEPQALLEREPGEIHPLALLRSASSRVNTYGLGANVARYSGNFEQHEDGATLRLTSKRPATTLSIDLSSLTEGIDKVVVELPERKATARMLPAPWPVDVEFVVRSDVTVELAERNDEAPAGPWSSVSLSAVEGPGNPRVSVEFVGVAPDTVVDDLAPLAVQLCRVELQDIGKAPRPIHVSADDAAVTGGQPSLVEVVGPTVLQTHVAELRVGTDDVRVTCPAAVRVDRWVFGDGVSRATVVGPENRTRPTRATLRTLSVGELVGGDQAATLTVDRLRLRVTGSTPREGLTVEGTGDAVVGIPQGAVVTGLTLTGSMTLEMEAGAVAHELSGEIDIRTVEHAHLEGAEDAPLRLRGTASDAAESPFRLATVLNVELVPAHASIPLVMLLEDCHRFRPSLVAPPDFEALPADEAADMASHYERLGDVARRRHSEGPVRAAIAWRSYRLREVASTDTTERRLLRVYRFLGYGQRWQEPAWVLGVSALVATAAHKVALHGWSPAFTPGAAGRFGVAFLTTVMGPLNYARSAAGWFPDGLGGAIYSLLLVPTSVAFAALLLALRQYVRVKA